MVIFFEGDIFSLGYLSILLNHTYLAYRLAPRGQKDGAAANGTRVAKAEEVPGGGKGCPARGFADPVEGGEAIISGRVEDRNQESLLEHDADVGALPRGVRSGQHQGGGDPEIDDVHMAPVGEIETRLGAVENRSTNLGSEVDGERRRASIFGGWDNENAAATTLDAARSVV